MQLHKEDKYYIQKEYMEHITQCNKARKTYDVLFEDYLYSRLTEDQRRYYKQFKIKFTKRKNRFLMQGFNPSTINLSMRHEINKLWLPEECAVFLRDYPLSKK